MENRSRWAITRVTGKSACSSRRRRRSFGACRRFRLPDSFLIRAMAAHKARPVCSTVCRIGTARRSALALHELETRKILCREILTGASIQNAMVLHAAFGGSTNLLLHIPAIAHAAGLKIPKVEDWIAVNRRVPRLVSVLPNGP